MTDFRKLDKSYFMSDKYKKYDESESSIGIGEIGFLSIQRILNDTEKFNRQFKGNDGLNHLRVQKKPFYKGALK